MNNSKDTIKTTDSLRGELTDEHIKTLDDLNAEQIINNLDGITSTLNILLNDTHSTVSKSATESKVLHFLNTALIDSTAKLEKYFNQLGEV